MRLMLCGFLLSLSSCYTTHVISRGELASLDGFVVGGSSEGTEVLVGGSEDGSTIPLVRAGSTQPRKYRLMTGGDAELEFGVDTELTFVPKRGPTLARKFTSLHVTDNEVFGTTVGGTEFSMAADDLERTEISTYSRGRTIALVASVFGATAIATGVFFAVIIGALSYGGGYY